MERVKRSNKFKLILGVVALTSLSLLAIRQHVMGSARGGGELGQVGKSRR